MVDDIYYTGEHSVTFNVELQDWSGEVTKKSKNSWDDWHLVPSSRPVIVPPKQKKNTINISGADGIINLSGALTNGRPVYNNREGSLEFIVVNGYGRWYERYSNIMDYLNAPKIELRLDDERWTETSENGHVWSGVWFYKGSVWVDDWKSNNDGTWSTITFGYSLDPYKYRLLPIDLNNPDSYLSETIVDKTL